MESCRLLADSWREPSQDVVAEVAEVAAVAVAAGSERIAVVAVMMALGGATSQLPIALSALAISTQALQVRAAAEPLAEPHARSLVAMSET